MAFSIYAILAAFSTYFCMYAFRKPFSVGTFEGDVGLSFFPGLNYKIVLIMAQVLGYTLSKFIGVKVVSELKAKHRALMLVLMMTWAEVALIFFGLVPRPWNIICIFLNGMPLGMIWGLVFGFLEGRKTTELLGAGLSVSYIIASGFVKSVGRLVMNLGVSEFWMPSVTGLIFFPAFLFSVWLLKQLPAPTKEEEDLRTKRTPMYGNDRLLFFKTYWPSFVVLILLYMFLTAYRDFRDNFAREIWDSLGYGHLPTIFTSTEIPVALGVLIALAAVMFIKNNKRALMVVHLIMLGGALIIGLSTWAFKVGIIGPVAWMILVGFGLYLGYVPYGCVLFDRLVATVRFVGTAGFMIYLTDASGYLGSVGLMLYKNFGHPNLSWLDFFIAFSYITSMCCVLGFAFSMFYFGRLKEGQRKQEDMLWNAESVDSLACAGKLIKQQPFP